MENKINKLARLICNQPGVIIAIFLLITVFFAFQLPRIEMDTAIKSLIPEQMPSRVKIEKIESIFGGTEIVMLTVEADDILDQAVLQRIKYISDELAKLVEVDQVNSPFTMQDIRGEADQLIIEDAIQTIPTNQQQKKALRKQLKESELVMGNVLADNFKAASLVAVLAENVRDADVLNKINKIIVESEKINNSSGSYRLAGLPVLRVKNAEIMQRDMRILMPVGILIMLIFLYLCFRQIRGVLLPFLVVIMSIIVALGLLPLLGWKFQLLTILLPVSLLAITNDYGIHLIANYQEKVRAGKYTDNKMLAQSTISSLGKPILATGITTIAGLLSLLAHIIVPARQLGLLAGAGIAFALLASLFLIPALLTLLPSKVNKIKAGIGLEKILNIIARLVVKNPQKVILISLIIVAVVATGILKLKIDTNPINFYSSQSELVKATELVNNKFGGANNISVVAKGDIKDPKLMQKINELEQKMQNYPQIGEVSAISKILREMNQQMHNGDPAYQKIPDSRNLISQYLLLFSMSGELDKLIDFKREHALITARIPANSTNQIQEVVKYIRQSAASFQDTPFILAGGFGDLLAELVDAVVKGQAYSLGLSILIVGLIVILLFQSITAGLIAVIPLILAMVGLFGLMGYFNIELNMVTAMLSSIMIGVGVDYTIHFLWRYREELKKANYQQAVKKTLITSGRGIIFNALSVIVGFSVLLISDFLPVKFFGFLVVVSIAGCLAGALILLPAICLVFKPAFLEKEEI